MPEQWAECGDGCAQFYGEYATDVGARMWSGTYGRVDAAQDSSRLFLRLARDWSPRPGRPGWRPPPTGLTPMWSRRPAAVATGKGRRTVEHTSLLVPARSKATPITITDLKRVGLRPGRR